MGLKEKGRVIGILAGAHPAHLKIFSEITQEILLLLGPWKVGHKVSNTYKFLKYLIAALRLGILCHPKAVLVEGISPSAVIAPIIRSLSPKTRVVSLFAEDGLLKILQSPNSLKSKLLKLLLRKIDGVIAIGKMIADQVEQLFPNVKIFLMYPTLDEKRLEQLKSLSYNPGAHSLIQIGGRDYKYKGVDLTLSLLKYLPEIEPGLELIILGHNPSELNIKTSERLKLPGKVDNVPEYLRLACLMVHPGRGDAFPVATLESMAAGVPVMVSELTGTKELLFEVDNRLVRKMDLKDLKEGLLWFFSLSKEEKIVLSQKCRFAVFHFINEKLPKTNKESLMELKKFLEITSM